MKKISKVLIVEDSKLFSNHLKRALEPLVEDVKQAFSFGEAECILEDEEKEFDYIFLDLILPDGEGDELIEKLPIKLRNRTIVLTGETDIEKKDYLFKLGILEYFSKLNPLNLIINDIKNLLKEIEDNKNYTVLVVDDSKFIRKTIQNVLRPRKYNVLFAETLEKAREIIFNNEVHLVFLDVELPDGSGVNLLEEIKSYDEFLELPVISISNNDNSILVARVLKHGAKDFIKKPFVAEYLVLKCAMHINSYKNYLLLEEQQKELEKAHIKIEELLKNVKDSINYASYIQNAILARVENFEKIFKEYFIIYQPKDVVSGDIYQLLKLNEDEYILMLIDCTGHGVPGAFVTMLVKAITNQVEFLLRENKIKNSPSEILNFYNSSFKKMLSQNSKDSQTKSNVGFDGGVLCFNFKENSLTYSGAEISLFYVRDNEVNKIRGDRFSIGYKKSSENFPFKEHTVKMEEGMKFYITTDGFIDQNGGEKDMPFGNKRFMNLIKKYNELDFSAQKEKFIEEIEKWKKDEQNDDITVIGFKI